MSVSRELKFFPELHHLPIEQQQQRLTAAKARAFGAEQKLSRWRGNVLQFGAMFGASALFMAVLVPLLGVSRDSAAIIMLVVVLPLFFIAQQRRYILLIRRSLQALGNSDDASKSSH